MRTLPRFYRNEAEFLAIAEKLKLTPCPHCHKMGTLNRHGPIRGFDDQNLPRKTLRGHRVFCSNRRKRPGCGRTFRISLADKIRRHCITTRTLWNFLQLTLLGTCAEAIRKTPSPLHERTLLRIGKRFIRGQSHIRNALHERGPPPHQSFAHARQPELAQVLAHLNIAFPHTDDPLAAFQLATQSSIL